MSRLSSYPYCSSLAILVIGGLTVSLIVLAFWSFYRGRRTIFLSSLASMAALLIWICGGFLMSKWENTKGPGKFKIRSTHTQIGTCAHRDFLDAQNRVVKSIYYSRPKMGLLQIWPKSQDFQVQSSREFEYDEAGITKKVRGFDASGVLRQEENYVRQTESEGQQKAEARSRSVRGRGERLNTVTFDSWGKKITGIRGKPQPYDNLAFKWSDQAGNLRLGVAVEADNYWGGVVTCNFWNVSSAKIIVGTFDLELRDSNGAIIPSRREKNHLVQPKDPPRLPDGHQERVIGPGMGVPVGESVNATHFLKFWYGHLTDGTYTLRVMVSEAGSSELLTSTIPLKIDRSLDAGDQKKRSFAVILH